MPDQPDDCDRIHSAIADPSPRFGANVMPCNDAGSRFAGSCHSRLFGVTSEKQGPGLKTSQCNEPGI
jgi:hypothetical protein